MARIRKVRVLSAALPVTLLILAGTAYADPVLAESMGLDVWEIGRLEGDLQKSQTVGQRLDAEMLNLQDLVAVNDLILADVAEGRMELSAAATRKWELNRHRPMIREHLEHDCAGANPEQRMAHDLYQRVRFDYQNSPDREAVSRRIRGEYEAAYHTTMPAPVR